ncbi:MAG: DNA polymerase III subunit beta [Ignavibacterium sp.]
MEFKINSKSFDKLLSKVIPAVPSRTPMAVLENFLFEIKDGLLTVCATDLEISLRSSQNVAADSNARMVVPAKLLHDIIRALPDIQLSVSTDSNSRLKLTTDKGVYHISYFSPEDFPEIPTVSRDKEIVIASDDLKRAFDKTSFAMSKEDMRPAMTGTLLEFAKDGLRFVATDGHRLVKYVNKAILTDYTEQYIIPERAISVLSKLLGDGDVKIYLSKTHASFISGDIEFITRLIGEKYPAYNSVIPLENENLLTVDRSELLSTIKRMLIFSSGTSKQVKFSITANNLEVSSENIDTGSNAVETIQCDYSGEAMDIGFNTAYVNDILSHLDSSKVVFKLHSPTKACIIEPVYSAGKPEYGSEGSDKAPENEEVMMLLMPVRLNN